MRRTLLTLVVFGLLGPVTLHVARVVPVGKP